MEIVHVTIMNRLARSGLLENDFELHMEQAPVL